MSQKDLAEMLRMDCYEYSVIKWRLVSQEWPAMNSFWMRVNDLGMFSNYDRINLDSVILKNGENPRCQRGSERRSIIAQTDTSRATFMPLFIMNLDLYIYRSFIFPLLENKKSCAEALHIKIGKCYFCTMACRFGFIFCLTRRHRFAMGVFNNLSMTEIIREIALKSNWLTCDQYIISSCFRIIENTVLFSGY